jgi:hypothetical protein
MAMGITQALKLQEGPINALAQLPQQQLMAMAQQGRIPADMLPIILNEKAQMAQQAANMQAMQQPMPPSVVEQAMAVNAQAEAPPPQMPPMDAGVAALPVPDDMYASADEGYAGGGIVAFARGDLVGRGVNEPFEGESYGDYLMRRAKESLRGPFFSEEGTMPRAGMSESQAGFYNQGRANQALFNDILSGKAPVPVRSADPTLMREATPPGYYADETTRGTARRIAQSGPGRTLDEFGVGATEKRDAEGTAKKAGTTKAAVPAKKEKEPEDFFARRNRMLSELGVRDTDAEDLMELEAKKAKLAGDREKAGYLALLEAGLGIMGGTSPYALQNIGAGAKGAVSSYGKSLREIKEDEKEFGKIGRELRKAADARKRGDVDKALEFEDKAEARRIQLMGVEAQRASAARPSSQEEYLRLQRLADAGDKSAQRVLQGMFGAAKLGQVDERFLRDQWGKMKPYEKMRLEQQGIKSFEQWAATQGYPVGGGAGVGGAGWGIREIK